MYKLLQHLILAESGKRVTDLRYELLGSGALTVYPPAIIMIPGALLAGPGVS